MNNLIDVFQYLWNLADDYIFFCFAFMVAVGVCDQILGLVKNFK